MQRYLKNDRLYRRVIVLFLILTLPTLSLGILFYHRTGNGLITEAQANLRTHLQTASGQIETQLLQLYYFNELIDSAATDYMNELNSAAPAYKVALARKEIASQLTNLRLLNDNLIDIALYIDDKKICTSLGVFPTEYYFQSVCRYQNYTADDFVALTGRKEFCMLNPTSMTCNLSVSKTYYDQEYNVLPVTFRCQTIYGNGVTIFTLDLAKLLKNLQDLAPYADANFAISRSDGQVVAATATMPDDFSDFLCEKSSANSVWNYTVWLSKGSVLNENHYLLALIRFIIAALVLTELLLSLLVGYYVSRPLMNIRNMLVRRPEVDIYRLNDIELQVDTMLRQLNSNEAMISRLTQTYMESALPALLHGGGTPNGELLHFLLAQQLGEDKPIRCIIVQTENDDVQKSVVREEVGEYFVELNLELMTSYILFIVADEDSRTRVIIEKLHARLAERAPDTPFQIFVGLRVETADGLAQSLDSCLTLAQTHLNLQEPSVAFADDVTITQQYSYTYQDELNLMSMVKQGDVKGTHERLEQILERNEGKMLSYSQMQRLYTLLISTALRYAESEQIALTLPAQTEQTISQRFYLHQLYDILLSTRKLRENLGYAELVEKVDRYIDENISENLFLDTIAAEFGITGKYLARVYKQETGTALTERIVQVRIALAKDLLKNTDMPVSQIMKQLGYLDRTTFMRNFKKVTGVAPQTYREVDL